jgi:hypothetical protein
MSWVIYIYIYIYSVCRCSCIVFFVRKILYLSITNIRHNILFIGKPDNYASGKISLYPFNNITYIISI